MKINWKLVPAVVVIAGGATGRDAQQEGARPGHPRLEADCPVDGPCRGGRPRQVLDRGRQVEGPLGPHRHARRRSRSRPSAWRRSPCSSQTEPTILSLFGTTDYDPATVTTVRPQFDSRVDKVLVDLGSIVKKDDPLLELFSTDLAAAKSDYEMACQPVEPRQEGLRLQGPAGQGPTPSPGRS